MLHGISCGAGMIIVNRLQSAGARMAAMWTAESHLDSCLGAQPGSFFLFLAPSRGLTSLVAQMVKRLSIMWETQVRSLVGKIP